MPRKQFFQLRRDSAADWASTNPTLGEGEPGYETDTGILRIGDGTTAYSSLGAFIGSSGGFPEASAGQFLMLYRNGTPGAPTLNLATYVPFDITTPVAINQIVAEVTTVGAAGAVIRAGLYADSVGGPGALIVDGGTADAAGSTGLKTFSVSTTLTPGRYWGTVVPQVATSTQRLTTVAPVPFLLASVTALSTIFPAQSGVSGALGAASVSTGASSGPCMALRVA